MPRHDDAPDWDDASADDPNDPQARDLDDADDEETAFCPACRSEISAQSERCPMCGEWITLRESGRPKSAIYIIIAVVLIGILLLMVLR